jgi:hypothetical protein
MLDHATFSYIRNRAERLTDWERFQDRVSDLHLFLIQVNSREAGNKAEEDASYRLVTKSHASRIK